MTKKAKRAKKADRLQPADVLQTRMEYYNGLARSEMRKGERGSREKIDEYLKLAQDAAKELGPYRHGKAQAGEGDEPKKHYVVRLGGEPEFENWAKWQIYYKAVEAKLDAEAIALGGEPERKDESAAGEIPARCKAQLNAMMTGFRSATSRDSPTI